MNPTPAGFTFGEAARLFAENLPVVDEMARRFSEEVNDYLDRIYSVMAERLGPDRLAEESARGTAKINRSWWLHHAAHWKVPHLWIDARSPDFVLKEVQVSGWVQQASNKTVELRQAVEAVDLPEPAVLTTSGLQKAEIFRVRLAHEGMEDNVTEVAHVLCLLLGAMMNRWTELAAENSAGITQD